LPQKINLLIPKIEITTNFKIIRRKKYFKIKKKHLFHSNFQHPVIFVPTLYCVDMQIFGIFINFLPNHCAKKT
jgi:hypothetical protein